jgi:hypothetical protein
MKDEVLREELRANADRIAALVGNVASDQSRWRPSAGDWSVREVVAHLHDEERQDFRLFLPRLLALERPLPPGLAEQGDRPPGNERELEASLAGFLDQRARSVAWLETLGEQDWDTTGDLPWGAMMPAGDMLASWVVHDLLHTRQLVELLHAHVVREAAPFDPAHAGEW